MIKTILGVLGLIAIGTICLFVSCACVLSGKISEEERKTKERANKVISKFGLKNQIKKFNEESFELQEALINANALLLVGNIDDLKEDITSEIADVLFLLIQFINYFNIKDLDILDKLVYKSERTLDRMEEGYYDKKRTD